MRSSAFGRSTSTSIVRVAGSSTPETRETLPWKVRPGSDSNATVARSPAFAQPESRWHVGLDANHVDLRDSQQWLTAALWGARLVDHIAGVDRARRHDTVERRANRGVSHLRFGLGLTGDRTVETALCFH